VISSKPLTAEWRGDLLEGVKVIKGTWADGSPLTAIPNYARNNRLGQEMTRTEPSEAAVTYAPGSIETPSATTNAAPAAVRRTEGGGRPRGGGGGASSMVWIKDATE
jgi:uncharacterized protein